MIKAQLPKEVLTVEDRFFGSLTLSQVIILTPGLLFNLAVMIGVAPALNINLVKGILIGVVSLIVGLLAYRFNGQLGWQWLIIIGKFKLRSEQFKTTQSKPETTSQDKIWPKLVNQDQILQVDNNQFNLILEVSGLNFELLTDDEQETILAQFSQFLNSNQGSWQILTKTRQLEIDDYLINLQRQYKTHLNRALIDPYVEFVKNLVSDKRILSRKFYLILCQNSSGASDLKVVSHQLQTQAEIATRSLQNLSLTTRVISKEETGELISQTLPINIDKFDMKLNQLKPEFYFSEGVNYCQINQTYCRNLAIVDYPAYLMTNWLIDLTKIVDNLDISYHYQHLPKEVALTKLNRKITELESRLNKQLKDGLSVHPEISQPLNSARALREQLYSSDSNLFQISIYLNIIAGSINRLNQLTDKLQASLSSRLFQLSTNYCQQPEGLIACSPIGVDSLKIKRNFDGPTASLTLPFINGDLITETGVLYGLNLVNNSLVIIDRFKLTNANSISLGQSGSGKSYATKLEILRLLMIGCQVIVIDPEAEYLNLAKKVDGQIIDLADPDKTKINLLDVGNWQRENKRDPQTIADLISIIDSLVGGLTNQQTSLLDQIIENLYQERSNPTLNELYQQIKAKPQLESIGQALNRFVNGSCGKIFNQKTNIDLENPLIVFNLANIADSLKPVLLLILNFYFKWQLTNKSEPKLLVIDEAWLLLENKAGAQLMVSLVRRARKHNLGVALISQQVTDFLNQPFGQTLIAQAALKSLFKTDSSALTSLRRNFHLSQYQINFIKTATPGKAIIIADDQAAASQIVASDEEIPLVETKPRHLTDRSKND